jgi:hypothetical protein
MDLQYHHRAETRQMYGNLTLLQVAGQQETREIGSSLIQLQVASQEEIIACIAQHNLKFDQLYSSLGLVELDLNHIKMKSDDTLLLVKQLANAIDQRADGSAMICVRVPRALYEPSLLMWKGVSVPILRRFSTLLLTLPVPGIH